MTKLEKEFLASLKALLIRYNIEIQKGSSGLDDDYEVEWVFSNSAKLRETEIYLTMDDVHKAFLQLKKG